jgi:hypothetical protein
MQMFISHLGKKSGRGFSPRNLSLRAKRSNPKDDAVGLPDYFAALLAMT